MTEQKDGRRGEAIVDAGQNERIAVAKLPFVAFAESL
jgi:hypothetical protein